MHANGTTPNTIPDAAADSQDGQDSSQDGGHIWLMGAKMQPHAGAGSQDSGHTRPHAAKTQLRFQLSIRAVLRMTSL